MKLYNNIKELLAAHDADNFWRFGRSLYKYTDCGPWTRLVLTEGRSVYYEDTGADDPTLLDEKDIIGIEIGSIVESSDVEVGPYLLRFPITDEELDKTVKDINDEASFYWDRDNLTHCHVSYVGEDYYFTYGWGDENAREHLPADIVDPVLAFIQSGDFDEEEEDQPIPNTNGATLSVMDTGDWTF